MGKKYLILVTLCVIMAAASIVSVIIVCPEWLSYEVDCRNAASACSGWAEFLICFALAFSVVMVAGIGANKRENGEYELNIRR